MGIRLKFQCPPAGFVATKGSMVRSRVFHVPHPRGVAAAKSVDVDRAGVYLGYDFACDQHMVAWADDAGGHQLAGYGPDGEFTAWVEVTMKLPHFMRLGG